jgi:hypothetical protein
MSAPDAVFWFPDAASLLALILLLLYLSLAMVIRISKNSTLCTALHLALLARILLPISRHLFPPTTFIPGSMESLELPPSPLSNTARFRPNDSEAAEIYRFW